MTVNKEKDTLYRLVGKQVIMKVAPYTTGKLMASVGDEISYHVLTKKYTLLPIVSSQQIALVNDLRLRPFYNDAETFEEKLLGIIIDSSRLINRKVNALGVSVVDNRLTVRSLSGTKVAEHMTFTENTSTQELYRFVSNASVYKNIDVAFILNCAGNVYKSFNDHKLEYDLVREWFDSFVKEYRMHLQNNDVDETKRFIITVLQKQLDEINNEKDPAIQSDTIDSHVNKLEKAIALMNKELQF